MFFACCPKDLKNDYDKKLALQKVKSKKQQDKREEVHKKRVKGLEDSLVTEQSEHRKCRLQLEDRCVMSKLKAMSNNNMQPETARPEGVSTPADKGEGGSRRQQTNFMPWPKPRRLLPQTQSQATQRLLGQTQRQTQSQPRRSQSFLNGTDTLLNSFSVIKSLIN